MNKSRDERENYAASREYLSIHLSYDGSATMDALKQVDDQVGYEDLGVLGNRGKGLLSLPAGGR